jgi:hypothetical protein
VSTLGLTLTSALRATSTKSRAARETQPSASGKASSGRGCPVMGREQTLADGRYLPSMSTGRWAKQALGIT